MTQQWRERLGRYGVWRSAGQTTPAIAAGLELLGYGAVWLGGSPDGGLRVVDELLDATSALVVGTSIVNIWKDEAAVVAESFHRIESRHPGRFILGVGAGHREATQEYAKPYEALAAYVDRLLGHGVPATGIVLAALGPRVLRLAAERTAGANSVPGHARAHPAGAGAARAGALLAPEHKAALNSDVAQARQLGRRGVRNPYLGLVNYTSNLRRLGFTDADVTGDGSDALIDALVALGGPEQVAAQLGAHLAAGADHVCVQLLAETDADPMPGYEQLAVALGL